jgi:thioredoxin reductase
MYDVIIVGAGPAGLSAALWLGRGRRQVLVCDAHEPRNAVSHAMHGFLTRDGIAPAEFVRLGKEDLRTYPSVEVRDATVLDVERVAHHFLVTLVDQTQHTARKILFATGIRDELPAIAGIEPLYGKSVFNCPFCDAWEVRDQPLAVYGKDKESKHLALQLTQWCHDLLFCTDGPSDLSEQDLAQLGSLGLVVRTDPIARLDGHDGRLQQIVFASGDQIPRRALFLRPRQHPQSDLPSKLGYVFPAPRTLLRTEGYEQASAPGVYVAGDAVRSTWVVNAASDGVEAAYFIFLALLREDLALS